MWDTLSVMLEDKDPSRRGPPKRRGALDDPGDAPLALPAVEFSRAMVLRVVEPESVTWRAC